MCHCEGRGVSPNWIAPTTVTATVGDDSNASFSAMSVSASGGGSGGSRDLGPSGGKCGCGGRGGGGYSSAFDVICAACSFFPCSFHTCITHSLIFCCCSSGHLWPHAESAGAGAVPLNLLHVSILAAATRISEFKLHPLRTLRFPRLETATYVPASALHRWCWHCPLSRSQAASSPSAFSFSRMMRTSRALATNLHR